MATWPVRGQQAPSYWDAQLKEYVDEMPALPAKIANAADPVGAALRADFVTLAGVAQTITSVKTFSVSFTGTGVARGLAVTPTINMSGTGSYQALYVNVTETAVGSGLKYLMDLRVDSAQRFAVNNAGRPSSILSATTDYSFATIVVGDSAYRWSVRADGYTVWGTGAGAVDTTLYRNGVNALKTDGSFAAASFLLGATASFLSASTLQLANASNNNIEMGRTDGVASTPFIDFHSGATAVDHDSRIIATGGNGTSGGGNLQYSGANHQFTGALTGAAYQSFVYISPTINQTGTGGYAGIYVDITETATGSGAKRIIDARVGGVNRFTVDRAGTIFSTSAGASDWVHAYYAGSETQPRFITLASGTLNWGPGGSTAVDTNLYRSGVSTLKTDHTFNAVTQLQENGQRVYSPNNKPVSASVPASAGAAGSVGQQAVDANYYYVCVATNTWKRAALATW